jgi:hypothetical protein
VKRYNRGAAKPSGAHPSFAALGGFDFVLIYFFDLFHFDFVANFVN